MTLARVHGRDFRCFTSFEFSPDPHLNVIVGGNGAGKTSLLEAIFVLGRGRSFRTGDLSRLRREGSRGFAIAGRISHASRQVGVRVETDASSTILRIGDREAAGLAELAQLLPVQIIEPGAHRLIEGGPARRRRFLDWGVFHVEPRFLDTWRRYQRALRQRNAGLKAGANDASLIAFEATLAEAGEVVSGMRRRHVDRLRPRLAAAAQDLLGEVVDCQYTAGWTAGRSLADALEEARSLDRRQQATRVGPQRADLQVRLAGKAARERVSRGEQKLLAASLLLAQMDVLASHERPPGVLLVDDPAAELDRDRLERLSRALLARDAQVFMTALPAGIPQLQDTAQQFHVEQGKVTKLL